MDTQPTPGGADLACELIGLGQRMTQSHSGSNGSGNSAGHDPSRNSSPEYLTAHMAEVNQLRAQIEQLRAERARLLDVQHKVMELLDAKSPDRILHDLRNLLNERELFKALIDAGG